MVRTLVRSVLMLVLVTAVLGVAFPLVVTGIAAALFPHQAAGSLVYRNGELVGSSLIGQNFTDSNGNPLAADFQPRPSAAGAAGYDPTSSGASNLGPSNPLLIGNGVGDPTSNPYATPSDRWCVPVQATDQHGAPVVDRHGNPVYEKDAGGTFACNPNTIPERAIAYRRFNGLPAGAVVPVDAVTASGSGLDPDISIANALDQAPRVARARNVPVAEVVALVNRDTQGRQWGFLGEPFVNVLQLNLDLGSL
jgi:potassium-transporting ATPase KdpC subunit